MALVACHECGHQVSTEAVACRACGAGVLRPVPTFGQFVNKVTTGSPDGAALTFPGWIKATGWVLGAMLLVTGAVTAVGAIYSTQQPSPAPTLATTGSAAPMRAVEVTAPAHNYSEVVGNSYAYRRQPNLGQRQQGMTSAMLQPMLVLYQGEKGGAVRFMLFAPENVGRGISYECAPPFTRCETDAGIGWTDVASGTILEAILQDAANGYLKVIPERATNMRVPG